MKKYYLFFSLVLFCISASAQLQGSFNYGNDGHIYFYLYNSTPYNVPLAYGSINYDTEETTTYSGIMQPYQTLVYGPNYGWVWLKGEVFLITYPNGQSVKWECPKDDPSVSRRRNISFGDSDCSKYRGKKCSFQGPYDPIPCKCSGFSCSNRDASICSKCKHHATKHDR